MNAIEKRIQDLYQLRPDLTAQPDIDQFWERALEEAGQHPLPISSERVEVPFDGVTAHRIAYRGFDSTPIYGWYLIPEFKKQDKYPAVVIYHGYHGDKLMPEQYSSWLLLGVAVLAVDVRGQNGDTGNELPQVGGKVGGWMTQNIMDKDNCYYKAIAIDAVRAVDWLTEQPQIDTSNIGVVGGSQGGGLSLLTAILNKKVAYSVADIPNLCHMDYGVLHSTGSLTEVAAYIKRNPDRLDSVLKTLSYFDLMNLADRLTVPVMVSVGLKDTVCMPETIFAAYNRIEAPKEIHIYPFNGHELTVQHTRKVLQFVKNKTANS
ncbi:acetylxylan esterase [Paenibacillus sp. IITD108]|uniref:acetylxylan esterase n=1 Tax=Paenibacillus sp. IITD108 TaxID=3116649 RepID=UPI002F41AF23